MELRLNKGITKKEILLVLDFACTRETEASCQDGINYIRHTLTNYEELLAELMDLNVKARYIPLARIKLEFAELLLDIVGDKYRGKINANLEKGLGAHSS